MNVTEELKKHQEVCALKYLTRTSFFNNLKWIVPLILGAVCGVLGWSINRVEDITRLKSAMETTRETMEQHSKRLDRQDELYKSLLIDIKKQLDGIDRKLK